MSTQYNRVQRPYDEWRKSTIALVERVNVRELVLPVIKDATVLDLACGTGFYSHAFLRWGASRVVGVDISSAMIEEARSLIKPGDKERISFLEADCSKPTAFAGGPFDLVFGAWFLNYAPSGKDMEDMYRNISLNVKPGGQFVATGPVPTNDPAKHIAEEGKVRPLPSASGGMFSHVTGEVDDGAEVHRYSDTPAGDLDFDTYHLRKEVFEAAANKIGFKQLQWSFTQFPEDFMQDPGKYGEDSNGGASTEELATYKQVPFYGLLSMIK